jgi:hypothetical protein
LRMMELAGVSSLRGVDALRQYAASRADTWVRPYGFNEAFQPVRTASQVVSRSSFFTGN